MKTDPYHIRTSFGLIAAKLVDRTAERKALADETGDKPKADLPGKGKIIDVQA